MSGLDTLVAPDEAPQLVTALRAVLPAYPANPLFTPAIVPSPYNVASLTGAQRLLLLSFRASSSQEVPCRSQPHKVRRRRRLSVAPDAKFVEVIF